MRIKADVRRPLRMYGFTPWNAVIARSDLSAVVQRAKAEATKQSILSFRGAMDCFAGPVIRRALARPVGWQ
jgi:hypothetical protein